MKIINQIMIYQKTQENNNNNNNKKQNNYNRNHIQIYHMLIIIYQHIPI